MKLINYKLQNQIEYLSKDKPTKFFKEYLQAILEDTSKAYYQKADYVGLSINELKAKIDTLSQSIKQFQEYKKKLSISLDIAKEITATVFADNGIDRIDGNIVSSITLTKEAIKTKKSLDILDSNEVMKLGYVKFEPDIEAITKALETKAGLKELDKLVSTSLTTITVPAKVKVNIKRSIILDNQKDELENIIEDVA